LFKAGTDNKKSPHPFSLEETKAKTSAVPLSLAETARSRDRYGAAARIPPLW